MNFDFAVTSRSTMLEHTFILTRFWEKGESLLCLWISKKIHSCLNILPRSPKIDHDTSPEVGLLHTADLRPFHRPMEVFSSISSQIILH